MYRITIGYNGIVYFDVIRVLDVNPISIGTQSRGFYGEQVYMDVLTTIEPKMKLGAVLNFKSLDSQVRAQEESYGLQQNSNSKFQDMHLSRMVPSTQKKKKKPSDCFYVTYNWAITRTWQFCPINSLLH